MAHVTTPKLRIEEPTVVKPGEMTVGKVIPITAPVPGTPAANAHDVDHWRRMAIAAGERLQHAEAQAKDLRIAADDARSRFTKYKGRLDSANEKVNELTTALIKMTAERDELRDRLQRDTQDLRSQLARQEVVARKVHEFRQSILTGPLWDLFAEMAVIESAEAGGEQRT